VRNEDDRAYNPPMQWLHYLCRKLITDKKLPRKLPPPSTRPNVRTIRASAPKRVDKEIVAKEEREAYQWLKESEKMLADAVARLGGKRTRSKTSALACKTASQFMQWWREKRG
jgi:succinylarginine dihydrolase